MSANSSVTSDMNARNDTALQRFTDKSVHKDDAELYLGTDGDVLLRFNTARNVAEALPEGQAIDVRGLNMAKDRYELAERFNRAPKLNATLDWPAAYTEAAAQAVETANKDFEILGTNAADANSTLYAEGGALLATAAGANDQIIAAPHLDAGQSAWTATTWGSDQSPRWEAVIQTTASVAVMKIWAGLKLTNTPTVATDADQVYFLYDTAAAASPTLWHTVYSIANVDTDAAIATSVVAAVAAATTYHLVIEIDASRIARFYVNGTLAATSTALTTAIDFIPYIGAMTTEAVAKSIRAFKTGISRKAGA